MIVNGIKATNTNFKSVNLQAVSAGVLDFAERVDPYDALNMFEPDFEEGTVDVKPFSGYTAATVDFNSQKNAFGLFTNFHTDSKDFKHEFLKDMKETAAMKLYTPVVAAEKKTQREILNKRI